MSILKKVISAVKKMFKRPSQRRPRPKKRPLKAVSRPRSAVKSTTRSASLSKAAKKKTTKVSAVKPKLIKKAAPKPKPAPPIEPLVGAVTHYFDKIKVCVIRIDSGSIKRGERLRIKGANGELCQDVSSMQIENEDVASAQKGQLIGLKVSRPVFVKDQVFKVKPS